MSLFRDQEPTPNHHTGILLPGEMPEGVSADSEVSDFLNASTLDQVICSLIHQLINVNHAPTAHDLVAIQNRYADLVEHLQVILRSYFQEPAGKELLDGYLSHFTFKQGSPVLEALIRIYKPLSPQQPKATIDQANDRLAAFEELLIQRADTDFRGIRLPALRKIS